MHTTLSQGYVGIKLEYGFSISGTGMLFSSSNVFKLAVYFCKEKEEEAGGGEAWEVERDKLSDLLQKSFYTIKCRVIYNYSREFKQGHNCILITIANFNNYS